MQGSALLKLSRALHGAEDLAAAVARVRTCVTENTRYNRAFIQLLHPDGKTFEIVGWVLPNEEMVRQRLATIDVSRDPFLQRLATATEPFVIADLRLDPLADQAQVAFFGNRTVIAIPMFEGDARIGPLVIPTFADQGVLEPFPLELGFLTQVASLLGVVIGRLRAEDARKRAEHAVAANQRIQALGRMAGEIAHDFSNLLQIIEANAELAMDELGVHPVRESLMEICDASSRAARLTRQLVAYSRGQVLEKQVIGVEKFFQRLVQNVTSLLPETIALSLRVAPNLAPFMADATQLDRAFLNLILNARDAVNGRGNIVIDVAERLVDGEVVAARESFTAGTYLVVSVTDDGAGMDRATQERIFEPFFSTKADERGTGLGLSVVDGVVRQHDGYVHVYSEPGLGTTFSVYLPCGVGVSPETESHSLASNGAPRAEDVANLNDVTTDEAVLVVDDEEPVRRAVERILLRAGYKVTTADGAPSALEELRKQEFNLLLTDVVLNGPTDGVSLAAKARQIQPQLSTLFMTGYARGRLSDLQLFHLSKPFSARELLLQLRRALAA